MSKDIKCCHCHFKLLVENINAKVADKEDEPEISIGCHGIGKKIKR